MHYLGREDKKDISAAHKAENRGRKYLDFCVLHSSFSAK